MTDAHQRDFYRAKVFMTPTAPIIRTWKNPLEWITSLLPPQGHTCMEVCRCAEDLLQALKEIKQTILLYELSRGHCHPLRLIYQTETPKISC